MQAAVDQNVFLAGELIVSSDMVLPQTLVRTVFDLFSLSPQLEALALVDEKKPVGLITRTKFFFILSRRYGYELYAKLPIITIMDTPPLIVSEEEVLEAVIEKALERPPQDIYDEIIVKCSDGTYRGLLSVKQLIIQQSNALTRSVLLKEMATARAQELERINQVKSQFLANVTHELRSPVNAIVGLAELLKMAADTGSIEQIQERLSFMMSTATNLRAVITNILDLSKIEAGKMEVVHQVVDVVSLLSEVAETARILLGDKPVTVRLTIPAEPVMITTDPIKLRQIVTNLTSNAAKFTDEGTIDICLSIGVGSLEIEISDTGIGIKEEDLDLVFTAFGQVEDATTKFHEGTGLGLTISRNLARLIGGAISVTSTYGKGTKFSVCIPLQNP
ncbi:MAG: hypothetical protein FD174_1683 [Geobacteraceae bacterium]|nr:MAG: hypothetical protein FD174_1683 [Geobacteraceae bacterium]